LFGQQISDFLTRKKNFLLQKFAGRREKKSFTTVILVEKKWLFVGGRLDNSSFGFSMNLEKVLSRGTWSKSKIVFDKRAAARSNCQNRSSNNKPYFQLIVV